VEVRVLSAASRTDRLGGPTGPLKSSLHWPMAWSPAAIV
jgi:hypothetical protein